MRNGFDIYANGWLEDTCSVCTNMSIKNMLKALHKAKGGKWRVADANFPGGEPNPNTCEHHKTYKHYMCEKF